MGEAPSRSQGSLWRRWDPHIHLPGTVLNDQFKGMSVAEALDQLAAQHPRIEAIGVTDYFTTASFRRAIEAQRAGAAPSILIFPNVEFRLDNATSADHGVNVHLLCAPEDVDGIDRFLGSMEFSWQERSYRADRLGLVQLGRDFENDVTLDESAALRAGVMQFKVNFEALRKALRTDRWARKSLLVAVAGGAGDGSSGLRAENGSFAARRQSIEALADIIFSSNPKQVAFWLGRGVDSPEHIERVYGGAKLCLHGSDAHRAAALGAPQGDRFSWLKGDPTFDTLKLACLAPESRCHIGSEPPTSGFTHGRVVRVSVASPEWFVDQRVPINPGLVAIIGARGSGKTALADLIAAGAGSGEPFENEASFVRRADQLLKDCVVTVDWSHDETTTCAFTTRSSTDEVLRPVRYLSQQFVERLCASHGVSDELLTEIERVVFEAWPVENRQEATTFQELLALRLGSAKERQAAELAAVLDLSDRITDVRLLRRALSSMENDREAQEKALRLLDGKIEELTKNADRTSANRLRAVAAALQARQREVQRLDRVRGAVDSLGGLVASARSTTFPRFAEKMRLDHQAAGLSEVQWAEFEIGFMGNVDTILADTGRMAKEAISAVTGTVPPGGEHHSLETLSEDELGLRTVQELVAERERLQQLVGLDESRTKQLKALTDSSGEIRARVVKLEADIERARMANSEDLVTRRLDRYRAYFDALLEEEAELRNLYSPLDAVLTQFGPSISKLRFAVRRSVDVSAWATRGEDLLDLRREGRFRGGGELAAVATDELFHAWASGDAEEAANAIHDFVTNHSDDFRRQRLGRGEDRDALSEWEHSISRWLYSTDHIKLRYSLEYDGLSIERLSPGSRGILLLLLYLAVDQEETDPLIIDQPEENLDPESVYSELVELFRTASRRRQIIMVTHNANLVVNTDVDQVIVAHCGSVAEGRLPELSYVTGGLERPEIRHAVCEVLEGGAEAFKQRARRLGLDLAIQEEALEA